MCLFSNWIIVLYFHIKSSIINFSGQELSNTIFAIFFIDFKFEEKYCYKYVLIKIQILIYKGMFVMLTQI